MEHFFNIIKSKKFDENDFANKNVLVTLKVDGTPFQIVFENGKASFHKRPKDNKSVGERVTKMDAFTNSAYYPIMTNLYNALKSNVGKFGGVKILNTEILVDNDHHKIQYSVKPKGNLCILNGISDNGNSIRMEMIAEYANLLGVEAIPTIFNGTLGNKMGKLKDYILRYCDPHNPQQPRSFKDDILNILGVKCNSPLMKTSDGHIEGFVFDFGGTLYKLDDPYFMLQMKNKRKDTTQQDVAKTDKALNNIYNYIKNKNFQFKKYSNNQFDNLLKNFDACFLADTNFISYLCSQGRNSLLKDMMYSKNIGMLPRRYSKYSNNQDFLYALRLFLWLFGKQKSGKNYPILQKFNNILN